MVKDKKIAEIKYQPIIEALQQANTVIVNYGWLPQPWITIPENTFVAILQTFQNLSYIGEMRQRWEEIKKLQNSPSFSQA